MNRRKDILGGGKGISKCAKSSLKVGGRGPSWVALGVVCNL